MAGLRLKNLSKRYGTVRVLDGIDLEIADGELVVFVGASGCGKSTLLRLVAGLETASSGEIWIGDRDVTDLAPKDRGVAMIFQSYALYPHMTAYQNIAFAMSLGKADKADVEARVHDVATMLRIGDLLDRLPRELSGGQRQRVAIARAIVRKPEVFLFDEPLSNLDAALRAHTRLELARMHTNLGTTMIHVTHDQLEAMTLGDRIVLLNQGHIEQVGTPAELYHHPATRYAAAFMGSPTMNLLPVASAAGAVRLSTGESLPVPGVPDMAEATFGIRPEDITLGEGGDADATLAAEVALVEDIGEARIVHASLGDGTLVTVRHAGETRPRPGDRLALAVDRTRQHVFGPDGRRVRLGSGTA